MSHWLKVVLRLGGETSQESRPANDNVTLDVEFTVATPEVANLALSGSVGRNEQHGPTAAAVFEVANLALAGSVGVNEHLFILAWSNEEMSSSSSSSNVVLCNVVVVLLVLVVNPMATWFRPRVVHCKPET